jgi:hypothetical protein
VKTQPVLSAAAYALVVELIGLLIAFGVPVTGDQRTAILGTVAAAGPVIGLALAWWASRKVTPLARPRDEHGIPMR